MKNQNKDENVNSEMEMIRDLRKRVYGEDKSDSNYNFSDHKCIFCGAEFNLHTYKNNYICHDCLSDLRDDSIL